MSSYMEPYSLKMSTARARKNMISFLNSGMMYLEMRVGSICLTGLQRVMGMRSWQIRYIANSFSTGLLSYNLDCR